MWTKVMVGVLSVLAIALIVGGVMVARNGSQNGEATGKNTADSQTSDKVTSTDIVVGTGTVAKVGDSITVKYIGSLDNGTVFDSTEKQGGTPATFTLSEGNLIKGWVMGIPGMQVGGKRKLVIPASLGYGAQGNGSIPANSTLTFEIELVSVN